MNTQLRVECRVHFQKQSRGRKQIEVGAAPARPPLPPGRVPRVTRLLALAHRFERLLRDRAVANYSDLARLGHVTPARVSQVMSLLQLAPDIQEQIIFLPLTERGRDPVKMHHLLPIAMMLEWRQQRRMWAELRKTREEQFRP
jgi:hypothetical protein